MGRGSGQQGGPVAPGGGGRGSGGSSEGVDRPGQQAAWTTLVAREEGGGEL
jgi:hypothetical protein